MDEKPTYEELEQRVKEIETSAVKHKKALEVNGSAKETLRQKNNELKSFLHNIPDMAWLKDADSRFIAANKAFCKAAGIAEEYLINNTCEVCFGEEAAKKFKEDDQKVMNGGKQLTIEEKIIDSENNEIWLETIKSPIFDRSGKAIGTVGIARNVTEKKQMEGALQKAHNELEQKVDSRTIELSNINKKLSEEINDRKQAEEALRESEERYKELFERSLDCIYLHDFEGNFINANPAALDLLGYTKEEITSLNIASLLSEDELLKAFNTLKDIIEKGGQNDLSEYKIKKKNGDYVYIESSGSLIYSDGKPYAIMGTARDITKRKQAEEALRDSEEKYRNLIDKLDDIIWTLDLNLRTTYVSPSIEKKLGFTPEERMAQDLSVQVTPASYAHITELLVEELNREKKGEADPNRIIRVEVEYYHKNGSILWIENIVSGLRDEKGILCGIHGVSRDITSRKKAEAEKEQLEAHLQQSHKMQAIGSLAGGIAHQFNNALSVITGNIDLLEMDFPSDENVANYAKVMKDSAHRMTQLIAQLLAYAKGGKYQAKTASLVNFIRETLPLVKHTIDSSIHVDIDLPQDILNVKIDITQLQMVLSNVLSNASEAMEGEGSIRVACRNKMITDKTVVDFPGLKPGNYACLEITDDGKGMDEETRKRVFEPFFSTKFEGRGLGMAAVYGTIKNHDGWISVDSEVDKGTIVKIYLPVVQAPVKEEVKPESRRKLVKGTGTILIIDDEEAIRDVTRKMLERMGYTVLEAKTGQEAINLVKTFDGDIDIAMLDILMPDMNGNEIYPYIKEARPDLKVLIFSGYSIDGPAREILNAGAEDFIQKPFMMADLSEKLKKILGGKQ